MKLKVKDHLTLNTATVQQYVQGKIVNRLVSDLVLFSIAYYLVYCQPETAFKRYMSAEKCDKTIRHLE